MHRIWSAESCGLEESYVHKNVDNLYVVEASFLPSSTAIKPSLTIVAQAVRTAEHLVRDVFKLKKSAA